MNQYTNRYHELSDEAGKLLEGCATIIEIPVAWGEMNAAQHVSNTVYFQYFEIARVDFFEQVNFVQRDPAKDIGIVLASISCKFIIPLVYPDTIFIGTKISSIQEDRFIMEHFVISHKHKKIAAKGEAVIVTYNYKKECKAPIPDYLLDKIKNKIKNKINEVSKTN